MCEIIYCLVPIYIWLLTFAPDHLVYAAEHRQWVTINEHGAQSKFIEVPWQRQELNKEDGGVSKECLQYLKMFSDSTSQFINCSVVNARPLHNCENCVMEYVSVNDVYTKIFNDKVRNDSVDCKKEILRADNIQIVLLTYNFIQSIWKKSTCDQCFKKDVVNKTVVYQPTNSTLTLLKKIDDALECFDNNGKNGSSSHNMSDVCAICMQTYCDANNYYEEVENENGLCSDLIDSMNYTRQEWGQTYNCTLASKDHGEIWGITAIVCSLPLFFYFGLWFYANPRFLRRSNPHHIFTNSD